MVAKPGNGCTTNAFCQNLLDFKAMSWCPYNEFQEREKQTSV